jgi:hypothetical protein
VILSIMASENTQAEPFGAAEHIEIIGKLQGAGLNSHRQRPAGDDYRNGAPHGL